MEKKINLVPLEMAVPMRSVRLAKILSRYLNVGGVVLLLLTIVTVGVYFFYYLEYKKDLVILDDLKTKVITLEKSEQKLFLAKDRLAKIKEIRKNKSIQDKVADLSELKGLSAAIPEFSVSEIAVDSTKTEIQSKIANSEVLTNIENVIKSITNYKNIIISSIDFNQLTGYVTNFLIK